MKRFWLICLLPLLLAGCAGRGSRERQRFLEIRSRCLAAPVELTAAVRGDYGDRIADFRLHYAGDGTGGLLTVLEPAELRDIVVELEGAGVKLRYDGALLDTGAVAGAYSPVQALPLLVQAWQSGCVTEAWREQVDGVACLAARMELTQGGDEALTRCTAWFRETDYAPWKAELSVDGYTVLYADFREPA